MKQAKAVYAFTARSENEISFNVGDIIFVIEEDTSSGWSKGRTKDYKEGYFPHNYVEFDDEEDSDDDTKDSVLKCIALYDFKALADTQISFKKGEFINITKKGKENDWWEGKVVNSKHAGLFPSNYVQLLPSSSIDPSISQIKTENTPSIIDHSVNNNSQATAIKENATPQPQQEKIQQRIPLDERVNPSLQHKLDGTRSDLTISGLSSDSNDSILSSSSSSKSVPIHPHLGSEFQNAHIGGYTPPNGMSPLTISTSFEQANANKDFATLSPISPALAAYSFSSADNARKRLSMHIPSSSPLPLSLGGENTRDFDALCLLYPYLPSSVSEQSVPGTPPMFSTPKLPTTGSQAALSAIPSLAMNFSRPQSAPQAFSHLMHQSPSSSPPQSNLHAQAITHLPQSNSQTTSQSSSHLPQTIQQQQQPATQPVSQQYLAPPSSSLPKPVSAPKLQTTATNSTTTPTTPDRKDRYSRAPSGGTSNSGPNLGAKVQVRTASSGALKYSSMKSPGRPRDASSSANSSSSSSSSSSASKRKAKLEGSLVLGKKPSATITHSNSDIAAQQQDVQVNSELAPVAPTDQQLSEVEYLKKVLHQEVELRAHLESVVHDAHGKLNAASHYIKDLKAELFQSNMDISQLRLTNRQLSEQLNKYQLVTRVTVATQTERDENIDKIRTLTEQIHELEETTDELNEQIATLKSKGIPRSPRSPRSPRGVESERAVEVRPRISYDTSADYTAVKEQFARVRACLLLEKEQKARLINDKVVVEEKLHKTEQHSKNIKRKLLSELQLKSDLNVRNQHIENQLQKLKEELAIYKQR